jgi:hypothetical protein
MRRTVFQTRMRHPLRPTRTGDMLLTNAHTRLGERAHCPLQTPTRSQTSRLRDDAHPFSVIRGRMNSPSRRESISHPITSNTDLRLSGYRVSARMPERQARLLLFPFTDRPSLLSSLQRSRSKCRREVTTIDLQCPRGEATDLCQRQMSDTRATLRL